MMLHKYFASMNQNKLVSSLCDRESLTGILAIKVVTGKNSLLTSHSHLIDVI